MSHAVAPFTVDEWEVLCRAPVITFLVVATADGGIQPSQSDAFGELLARRAASVGNALINRVMRGTLLRRDILLDETAGNGVEPGAILQATRVVLDARLPAPEARAFKISLIGLGKAVAESSRRRGLLGAFRGRISRREKIALVRIARHLGLAREE